MAESSAGTPQIIVSAVVPVYCGAPYLPELVGELKRLRDRWAAEDAPMVLAELILVDDAAIDNSPAVVDRLARDHTWISAIHLARNFGQHPATIAGILHSSGDWVATLDEDLQHPPWQIDDLLREATLTNCDVVYANAEAAVHENLARDLSSDLVKRLVARLSGNPNIRHVSSFRLMRGSIARAASSVCGHETYFDVALSWFTERVGIVRMPLKDQRVIAGGRSNYRLLNLLSHTRRMLMSSRTNGLRIGGAVGLVALITSFAYGGFIVAFELLFPGSMNVRGWPSLIVAITFFGGILTFMVGVALEYLSALAVQAHGKPIFFAVDRTGDAAVARFFDRTTQ